MTRPSTNPRRRGQSTDYVCANCQQAVAYYRGAHSGLWCHVVTGDWRCSAPFTGDANTHQILAPTQEGTP